MWCKADSQKQPILISVLHGEISKKAIVDVVYWYYPTSPFVRWKSHIRYKKPAKNHQKTQKAKSKKPAKIVFGFLPTLQIRDNVTKFVFLSYHQNGMSYIGRDSFTSKIFLIFVIYLRKSNRTGLKWFLISSSLEVRKLISIVSMIIQSLHFACISHLSSVTSSLIAENSNILDLKFFDIAVESQ